MLRELADIVTPAHLVTDPDTKRTYEVDWTRRFEGATDAVVRPGSVAEVAAVVAVVAVVAATAAHPCDDHNRPANDD